MTEAPGARPVGGGKIPVTVLTGFLGAGKTTLLNKLVRRPEMRRTAVIINELGDIAIDHDLVKVASETMALLSNGCLCCSVRTDLQQTLRELFAGRRTGEVAEFDRVLIETTGLADPAPVIQTFSNDGLIGAHYRLDGVVTLVDAVNAAHQLQHEAEAARQAALADRLLLTKTDLADGTAADEIRRRLRVLNPRAPLRDVTLGEVEPDFVLSPGMHRAADARALERFLGIEPDARGDGKPGGEDGHAGGHSGGDKASSGAIAAGGGARYLGAHANLRHDSSIRTFSLRFGDPFRWNVFSAAVELLTALRGPDLLRLKGIVNVEGEPVVVQGVQHLFHAPVTLEQWPSDDRSTRMVFITRNIGPATVRRLFAAAADVARDEADR